MDRKNHWENVYQTKQFTDVSWYQPSPVTSLNLIAEAGLLKDAAIIDVGGGDSFLVDHLLELGYTNITVLDISATAINKAKARLSDKACNVKWIVADASQFVPSEQYDLWHDRAAFHFLTGEADIAHYKQVLQKGLKRGGAFILGAFSEQGPKKCSALEIKQYSADSMTGLFDDIFERVKCLNEDHLTPFNTVQNFTFCRFKRRIEY